MAINYVWSIIKMEAYSNYGGNSDVVFNVHWTLTGDDGEYASDIYSTVNLAIGSDDSFTPYTELTEAQVVHWVQSALGVDQVAAYEASIAASIQKLANPPVVTPTLPWSV